MSMVTSQEKDEKLLKGWSILGNFLSGFRHLAVLRCAHQVGLFRKMQKGAQTAEQIATSINANNTGIELMLNTLVSMNLVSLNNNQYQIEAEMADYFNADSEYSLLSEIENVHVSLEAWMNLDKLMLNQATNNEQTYGRMLFDGNCHQYKGLQAYNRIQARPIIAYLINTLGDFVDILDIAGADGYIPNMILTGKHNTNITIIDLPQALDKCGTVFHEHVANNRMHLVSSDAREFELQRTFDLVIVTEVTELFNFEDKSTVIQKAYAHTKPGGIMVVTKFAYTESDLEIEALTFFSLKMFTKLKDAYLETDNELESILAAQNITFEKHRFGDKSVYICQK